MFISVENTMNHSVARCVFKVHLYTHIKCALIMIEKKYVKFFLWLFNTTQVVLGSGGTMLNEIKQLKSESNP